MPKLTHLNCWSQKDIWLYSYESTRSKGHKPTSTAIAVVAAAVQ